MSKLPHNYSVSELSPPPPYTNLRAPSTQMKSSITPSAPSLEQNILPKRPSYNQRDLLHIEPYDSYEFPINVENEPNQSTTHTNFHPAQKAIVHVNPLTTTPTLNESFRQDQPVTGEPSCFNRPPQLQLHAPSPFPAFQIPWEGRDFQAEFPLHFPALHYMTAHDIFEADWVSFISDLVNIGRVTGKQKMTAAVLPVTMGIGATGFLLSRAIERKIQGGYVDKVSAKIDIWNYCFFNSRGINIALYQGQRKVSGTALAYCAFSTSSSEEETVENDSTTNRELRKAAKAKRKQERRQRRELRRQDKKLKKKSEKCKDPFFLRVEPI